MAVDGRKYDHLALDIKGDPKRGFTEKFRIEVKKCLDEECQQTIQGSAVIRSAREWETVNVPLNKLTGLIDFRTLTRGQILKKAMITWMN